MTPSRATPGVRRIRARGALPVGVAESLLLSPGGSSRTSVTASGGLQPPSTLGSYDCFPRRTVVEPASATATERKPTTPQREPVPSEHLRTGTTGGSS
jgi:hypothetical protein